ncbi:MAG: DegT/DnrJ/EryC1/StrS family aminotransferase [Clostridia bacterium]|nr:DegT/DnrJ/EryC1/StrS family aminotransferase [Clostridia bacterium]
MSILVTRSSLPPFEEFQEEIQSMWETHWLTNLGVKHCELEEKLRTYLDVFNLSLFTNGHLALEMVLQALELTGEVITTPFSFASTTHAIVRNGLEPVFCDIKASDYTLDPSLLEALITEKTSAILPVHVYGNVCDIDAIQKIADKYNLRVIYDAAHAFAETYKGQGIGNFGDASMFSFHATKVFHTIEGGAVSTSNASIKQKLEMLKNFGITGPEDIVDVGGNAKMNEFQAAMGLCNLRHLGEEIAKRKQVVERYRENLTGISGIKLNTVQAVVIENYAYFPVVFDQYRYTRDQVFEKLKEHEIYARKYFYPTINTFACYSDRYDVNETPIAQYIADRVLTLPLYADLSLGDVDRICDIITT